MFKGIRKILGNAPAEMTSRDKFEQLNTVAPLKSGHIEGAAGTGKSASFICREAILDRSERIAGYEFALGRELQSRMLEKSELIRKVYDDAMLRNLAPIGVSSLLGNRFALIRLSISSLRNPLLKTFANLNTLIMITPGELGEADLTTLRANLLYLEKLGIRHGWTVDRARPELTEFLKQAELVEITSTSLDGIQLKTLYSDVRENNATQKLIAGDLQTSDDFNLCYQLGFDYFMGAFVTSRENWHPAKSDVNRIRVFEALNMIRSGAEFDAIADCLRTDPILTYKLLRYINSPGIGLLQKITEIHQALMLLGRDKFYRWLSLLLFDFNQPGYREVILNEQALTRARFMELLSGHGCVPVAPEHLFMTGLLSLLDVMMSQPLEEILKQVSLPSEVLSALKGESCAMRDALLLVKAAEISDSEEMAAAAEKCGLNAEEVAGIMLEALSWSQKMMAATVD